MKKILTITVLSLVLGSPATANTVVNKVGGEAMDSFAFTSVGATYRSP